MEKIKACNDDGWVSNFYRWDVEKKKLDDKKNRVVLWMKYLEFESLKREIKKVGNWDEVAFYNDGWIKFKNAKFEKHGCYQLTFEKVDKRVFKNYEKTFWINNNTIDFSVPLYNKNTVVFDNNEYAEYLKNKQDKQTEKKSLKIVKNIEREK